MLLSQAPSMKMLLLLVLLFSSLQESAAMIGGFRMSPFDLAGPVKEPETPCDSGALSCEGRCNDSKHLPCSCDTLCVGYGDCCFDYKDVCAPPATGKGNKIAPSKCYSAAQSSERLINRCPEDYKELSIVEKCHKPVSPNIEAPFQDIPFTDGKTKLNYRNQFCALCNNATDLTGWDMRMKCEGVDPINRGLEDLVLKLKSGTCKGTPSRPRAAPTRPCIIGAVQQCPTHTEPHLQEQCKAYMSYVKTDKPLVTKYANIHCLRCNNGNEDKCFAIMKTEPGLPAPLVKNIFKAATLVWNPAMKTWSLSLLKEDEYNIYSNLLVCELEKTSQSNCSSLQFPNNVKDKYPMSIVIFFEISDFKSTHDDIIVKLLNQKLFRQLRNNSWTYLGHFITRKIKNFNVPYSVITYFFFTDKRLDYNTKRELIDKMRRSIIKFHHQYYPSTIVLSNLKINNYHGINERYDTELFVLSLQPLTDTHFPYTQRRVENSGTQVTCSLLSVLVTLHLMC